MYDFGEQFRYNSRAPRHPLGYRSEEHKSAGKPNQSKALAKSRNKGIPLATYQYALGSPQMIVSTQTVRERKQWATQVGLAALNTEFIEWRHGDGF